MTEIKKILVPTDFSENANNALQYAINIGDYFDAEIILLHSFEASTPTDAIKSFVPFVRADAEKAMEETLELAQKSVIGKTVLKSKIINGQTVHVITKIAKQEGVDLIIMGTQGASGLKEFLGSNTSAVMSKTAVPILAIPRGATYHPLQEIIFPVDEHNISDFEVIKPLLQIAEKYGSTIKILHLGTEKTLEKFDRESLDFFFKDFAHSYFTKIVHNGFNEIINKFTYEQKGDMIAMIRRERGFWERIFHESTTAKEIFNSPVPLLVLHSK